MMVLHTCVDHDPRRTSIEFGVKRSKVKLTSIFWPDCKAIPAYGLMMSVRPSVRPSVRLSVRLSTFWLTFAFKFVLGHINQYRLDALHGNRPW